MSSNWQKLQSKLQITEKVTNKRKYENDNNSNNNNKYQTNESFIRSNKSTNTSQSQSQPQSQSDQNDYKTNDIITNLFQLQKNIPNKITSKYVGVDCEMVGIGSSGKSSVLAR